MSWVLREILLGDIGAPISLPQNETVIIGRKVGNFIQLHSSYASRVHCSIRVSNKNAYIVDNKTLNGTFIGVTRIPTDREIQLRNGDLIGIGLAANEYSKEKYFQIFQADVDPEVLEIVDTCDATQLYIPDKGFPDNGAKQNSRSSIINHPRLSLVRSERPPSLDDQLNQISKLNPQRSPTITTMAKSVEIITSPINECCNESIIKESPAKSVKSLTSKQSTKVFDKVAEQCDIDKTNFISKLDAHPSLNSDKLKSNGSEVILIEDSQPPNKCVDKHNVKHPDEKSEHRPEFSVIDDDIILIDSDEDEDNLPCSQFFLSNSFKISNIKEEVITSFLDEESEHLLSEENEYFINGNMEAVENALNTSDDKDKIEDTMTKQPYIHSQLSPETYLTRIQNENKESNIEKNLNQNLEDVLAALSTQKDIESIEIKENLNKEVKKNSLIKNSFNEPNKNTNDNDLFTTAPLEEEKIVENLSDNIKCDTVSTPPCSVIISPLKLNSLNVSKRKCENSTMKDRPIIKSPKLSKEHREPCSDKSKSSVMNRNNKKMDKIVSYNMKKMKSAGQKLEESMRKCKGNKNKVKTDQPYNLRPSEKSRLKEIRKVRLKEVAEKERSNKTRKTDDTITMDNAYVSNVIIKNTDHNRGSIFIENIPCKPSLRPRKHIKSEEKKRKSPRSSNESPKNIPDGKSDCSETVISNSPKVYDNKTTTKSKKSSENTDPHPNTEIPPRKKSSLKSRNNSSSNIVQRKSVTFPDENQLKTVKYYNKDPLDSSVVNFRPRCLKGSPISKHEFLYIICKWNPKWIEESANLRSLPPLINDYFPNPSPVVSTYQNYADYQNSMLPLQIYELWETLLRDVNIQKQNPFIGIVRDVSVKGVFAPDDPRKMDIISIYTFVSRLDCMPRNNDFVIIRSVDNSQTSSLDKSYYNKAMWLGFGCIYSQPIKKPLQHSDQTSMAAYQRIKRLPGSANDESGQIFTVYFQVAVRQKNTKFWRRDQEISIISCTNLMNELKLIETLENLYYSPICSLILNPSSLQFKHKEEDHMLFKQQQSLNKEQMTAVNYCSEMVLSSNPSIALIHGPPGTGKSTVITHLMMTILDHIKKDKLRMRILLCAPSNFAVDQLVSKLLYIRHSLSEKHKNKFNMVRVGMYDMMSDEAKNISLKTLSEKTLKHFSNPAAAKAEIELLHKREKYFLSLKNSNCDMAKKKNLDEEINAARRYIRDLGLLAENKADQNLKNWLLRRYEKDLLIKADIVATTLSSSLSLSIQDAFKRESSPFGCCIIDEASQATELQTLIPIKLNIEKFILVGDHKQLSPVILCQKAKADGLEVSLFQRFFNHWRDSSNNVSSPVFPLVRQYRMNREIADFPSKTFYNSTLQSERPQRKSHLKPYLVFNHAFNQLPNQDRNIEEVDLSIKIVKIILNMSKCMSIGIITPYQSQRELFKTKLNQEQIRGIDVMTIDSAQGQERDIIILSCVKTQGVGFLGDHHRLNVALTRAKHALYIVANFKSLQDNQIWSSLLADAKSRKVCPKIFTIPSESVLKKYVCC